MKFNTVQEMILDSMNKNSKNIAIEYGEVFLTYSELDNKSNIVANSLIKKGIEREAFVGIMIEDRINFIIALLGVIKAGCAFVPMDTSYPDERLKLMVDTCDINWLITCDIKNSRIMNDEKENYQLILFEKMFENEDKELSNNPIIEYYPEDKIYIYFTSGTTGTPKAIVGKNISLVHFIQWEIAEFYMDCKTRVSQLINVGFDVFLRDIFVPLCAGGVSCIPQDRSILFEGSQLVKWIKDKEIQLIHCVPSLFKLINDNSNKDSFNNLRYILLCGEKVNPKEVGKWYDKFDEKIKLINLYGPTETTMAKTAYIINKADSERDRIPIGKPIDGCRIIILDKNMKICTKDSIGEIYIRTPYRTHGYYNNPNLNKERFIKNPFNNDENDLIYKTGDLGRLLQDGNIELLGRNDRQIKIRGNRVELEEIENVLLKHDIVKEAVVINKEISVGIESLVAFIVIEDNDKLEETSINEQLKEYISCKVPNYMIPNHFIILKYIDKKQNGKVDYDALANKCLLEENTYVEPRSKIEEKIGVIWCKILNIDKVGVKSSFFKMGGSSLNIMKLIVDIQNEFDINITLADLFNNITIKEQAKLVENLCINNDGEININKDKYGLLNKDFIYFDNNSSNIVFAFPSITGYGIIYDRLANEIKSYSIYSFNFIECEDRIEQYIKIITDIKKEGPYIFLGYSAGGNIAFEVANEMINKGYDVSDIIMIDSPYREAEREIVYDEDMEKEIEEFINYISNDEEYSLNVSELKREIRQKVQGSFKYHSKLLINGKLKSNIHFVKSEYANICVQNWGKCTTGVFKMYNGLGNHQNMLDMDENYNILSEILREL